MAYILCKTGALSKKKPLCPQAIQQRCGTLLSAGLGRALLLVFCLAGTPKSLHCRFLQELIWIPPTCSGIRGLLVLEDFFGKKNPPACQAYWGILVRSHSASTPLLNGLCDDRPFYRAAVKIIQASAWIPLSR